MVGGKITVSINGIRQRAKGKFTYNLGGYTNTEVLGHDGLEGTKSTPRAAMIEGILTDSADFDVVSLYNLKDATILLELANGKNITFQSATYTGSGDVETEEGEINFKAVAKKAFELKP